MTEYRPMLSLVGCAATKFGNVLVSKAIGNRIEAGT